MSYINNVLDLVIAVLIDWIIGDPYWFPHPVIYIGKFISFLERSFRKIAKSNFQLKVFGGIIVFLVCTTCYFVTYLIISVAKINVVLYHTINILIFWTVIAARCLDVEATKVYNALKNKDIEDARIKLSYIVGRDTKNLSQQEIIRADVETVAENTSDGVIAPMIYLLIGGAPLAIMYKAINTMDSMLGYLNYKYKYIGFFPAKVDDFFNYIPARITGVLIALSAPIVKGNISYSLKIMIRDRKNHKSPNCAYPEAAAAGAMKIQLGGSNIYFGEVMYKPTMGDKIKNLNKKNIRQVISLMYSSEIILLLINIVIVILVKSINYS